MLGQRIGNYRIVRKIGDGGMGTVYEAMHDSIGRRAAVKVLRAAYSKEPTIVARFFNEARAVNIVQHPGIVGSFDYGQLEDGTAYIVMEYVDGESLGARIKRLGQLGPDALRLARQIAGALVAAHTKGIIHRDLKPDNVLIVADAEAPGGERARVLDFGIAKIVSNSLDQKDLTNPGGPQDHGSMTQTGVVMGTPKYMSPEQCKGAGQVDARTDVYSLGVMLFEMLGGRLPFIAEGTGALIAMHIYQPPPPLSQFAPSVAPQVEALVNVLLTKEPGQRPSMADVVRELERLGATTTQGLPAYHSTPGMSIAGLGPAPANSASRPSIVLAAGQTEAGPPRPRRLGRFGVPLLAGGLGLVVAAGILVSGRRPASPPITVPAIAPPPPLPPARTPPVPAPAPPPALAPPIAKQPPRPAHPAKAPRTLPARPTRPTRPAKLKPKEPKHDQFEIAPVR